MIIELTLCAGLAGADYGSAYWPIARRPEALEVGPVASGFGQKTGAGIKAGACAAEEIALRHHTRAKWVALGVNAVVTGVIVAHNIRANRNVWKPVLVK